MTDGATVRIPRRFYDDHEWRGLPTPVPVKQDKRNVWIALDDEAFVELVNDAEYYAGAYGPDGMGDGGGLVRSATSLLKALRAALQEPGGVR